MIYLGIDPGMDGAAAVIDGENVQFFDTPTLDVGGGKKNKRTYDVTAMADYLNRFGDSDSDLAINHVVCGIESVHSMPEQGVASSFAFGVGFGMWLGILAALKIPYTLITPQRWKKVMMDGMGKEKDASRIVAMRLFPSSDLHLKKHHGRADALLIAEFCRRTHHASQNPA